MINRNQWGFGYRAVYTDTILEVLTERHGAAKLNIVKGEII